MRKFISLDRAIKRGQLMVNIPVFIVIVGCPILGVVLSNYRIIPEWGIGVTLFLGFILSWLVWGILITKWRIWAFNNVRNVYELKKRAIEDKLIWRDDSFFAKTEIRGREDKRKLKQLEKKFEQKDIFREDRSVPPRTEIFYSKLHSYIEFIVSVFVIAVGIFMISIQEIHYILLSLLLIGIGIYSTFKEVKKILDKDAQIIIDDRGIRSKKVGFKSWSAIENEEVIKDGSGKNVKTYLVYFYDGFEHEKIQIDRLSVSIKEMKVILRTYRIRYSKKMR